MFDIKDEGKIATSELGNAVRSIGHNPSEGEVKEMIRIADKKGINSSQYSAKSIKYNTFVFLNIIYLYNYCSRKITHFKN